MKPALTQLSFFRVPLIVFLLGVLFTYMTRGLEQALIVALLAVLEISLSFDNAVINAGILRRLSAFWQRLFLTLGLVIAVVGMRLVFPVVIVAVTAGLNVGSVVHLVLHNPVGYGVKLHEAHPVIAAFGGMFLLMIFLDFLIDSGKRIHWVDTIERPLAQAGRLKMLPTLLALTALLVVSKTLAGNESARVVVAGVIGLVTCLGVRGFRWLFERVGGAARAGDVKRRGTSKEVVQLIGRGALSLFIYLEVLDASFSFDGVVGAFAITSDVFTIALGLGIGALFVRALTIWLVRHNVLREFVYLEHGAHYAVGALAVLLAVSLRYEVPELVTGLVGAGFIVGALGSSLAERRVRQGA